MDVFFNFADFDFVVYNLWFRGGLWIQWKMDAYWSHPYFLGLAIRFGKREMYVFPPRYKRYNNLSTKKLRPTGQS